MSKQIQLDAPNISSIEKEYLNKAVESGFVSTYGPFVEGFEKRLANYLKVNDAVSTQSGTAALHMALYELKIGPGDEVIVPVTTFVASVNPIMYVGAKPVFADIDPATWTISPKSLKEKITSKTKAIIPVHLFGNCCDMDQILSIAKKHNLYVIEDATQSLGATYNGQATGTFGDFGVFSFNGNKMITTGGGGMIVGKDPERISHIKFLVNQARDEEQGYFHPEIGFNYRMTNLEAALGLAQMERFEEFLDQKITFNKIYRDQLKDVESIRFQENLDAAEPCWWLTSIILKGEANVIDYQEQLKTKGILTRRVFMPIVEFPDYKDLNSSDYRNAYSVYEKGLSLPGSTLNSKDDIKYVCQNLKEIILKPAVSHG